VSASGDTAQRALGGWLILVGRQVVLTLLTFGGVVALGRLLGPADFALYGYTTIGVTLALSVGDLGLGARLIHTPPSPAQLSRMFGAQLSVAGLLMVALGAVALLMPEGDRLAAALVGAAIVLAALQALPTAELERRLSFGTVAAVEMAQRAVFVAAAVALAAAGAEAVAVPAAAVGAGAGAYAAVLVLTRWSVRPRLGGIRESLAGFGSEVWQGRLAAQVSYAAFPVLGGLLFSAREVGFLVLGLTVTSLATLMAPLVARVTFPAMATSEPEERLPVFREVYGAYVIVSLPLLAVLAAFGTDIVEAIFGEQWRDAAPALRLLCAAAALGTALTPSIPLLYLVLEPRWVKRVLVGWTVTMWVLTPLLAPLVGLVAPVLAAITAGTVALVRLDLRLHRATRFSLVRATLPALAAATLAGGAGWLVHQAAGGTSGLALGLAALLATYAAAGAAVGLRLDPRGLLRAAGGAVRRPAPAD
jgi:PST family polysaccharide transporter